MLFVNPRFTSEVYNEHVAFKSSLPGGDWPCGLSGPSPHGQQGSEMIFPASLLPSEGSSSQCHDQVAEFPPCRTLQETRLCPGPLSAIRGLSIVLGWSTPTLRSQQAPAPSPISSSPSASPWAPPVSTQLAFYSWMDAFPIHNSKVTSICHSWAPDP